MFSVLLRGTGVASWHQLLLDIGYDPQAVQLVEVRAGALFDPSDGNGSLLQQGAGNSGRLRVTLARPESADGAPSPARGPDNGPPSDLLILSFKALRSGASTALTLKQADPQPAPASAVALPAEHGLRVMP